MHLDRAFVYLVHWLEHGRHFWRHHRDRPHRRPRPTIIKARIVFPKQEGPVSVNQAPGVINTIVNTKFFIFEFETDTSAGIDVLPDGIPTLAVSPPGMGVAELVPAPTEGPGRFAFKFSPTYGVADGPARVTVTVDAALGAPVTLLSRDFLFDIIPVEASVINGGPVGDPQDQPVPAPEPAPGPAPAPTPSAIVVDQVPVSGTPLLINGAAAVDGIATLTPPRTVTLMHGAETADLLVTITGTGADGAEADQTMSIPAGAAGTITSTTIFATVSTVFPAGGVWTGSVSLD